MKRLYLQLINEYLDYFPRVVLLVSLYHGLSHPVKNEQIISQYKHDLCRWVEVDASTKLGNLDDLI